MNDAPTTGTAHQQFLSTHQVAIEVRMHGDEEAPGHPTLIGWVIPKIDDPKEALEQRQKLLRVVFGNGESGAEMAFYRPDGSAVVDLHQDEGDKDAPEDDIINGPLNEAWSGTKDSGFMEAIHGSIGNTVRVMIAAGAMAGMNGDDPQNVYDELARMASTWGEDRPHAIVTRNKAGEVNATTLEEEETP